VARIHGRFGLAAAAKLLRGAEDPRLRRSHLDLTPTFGVLAEHSDDWLQRLLRRCVVAGWVDFEGGDRPVAVLTEEGIAVMRGDRPVRLILPPARLPRSPGPGARTTGRAAVDEADALDPAAQAIFDALRRHRLDLARAEGVPPYVVASDRSLRDVARLRPRDLDELKLAHGIGDAKAARYGEGLLRVVAAFADEGPRRAT
jgi:ATP-dependent DNA helicase RecQ